ncbi:MAG TPA: 6,7-dimethyl-8-ribityllumazine synthase [Chthoniobacterales bacterium]|jgi:6,7-dimethyl-8-ribityllumazine synthase
MSSAVLPRPRVAGLKRKFALVASQFNAEFVQGLINHATDEIRSLVPNAQLSLHQVPGAFEIPIVVRELAATRDDIDAILAIGVIIQGATAHAEHLASSVTNALQQIAIDHRVPVINAVLSVEDEAQARERCLEKKINRGIEAARAAVQIAGVMQELRGK